MQDETEESPVGQFRLIMFASSAIYSTYPRRRVRFEDTELPGRIEECLLDKSAM